MGYFSDSQTSNSMTSISMSLILMTSILMSSILMPSILISSILITYFNDYKPRLMNWLDTFCYCLYSNAAYNCEITVLQIQLLCLTVAKMSFLSVTMRLFWWFSNIAELKNSWNIHVKVGSIFNLGFTLYFLLNLWENNSIT